MKPVSNSTIALIVVLIALFVIIVIYVVTSPGTPTTISQTTSPSPASSPTSPTSRSTTNTSTPITTFTSSSPSTTSPSINPEEPLKIVNAVLYLTIETQKINETYSVDWITVTLQLGLKNTGDKVITIKDIRIDPQQYPLFGATQGSIKPGYTLSGSYFVILNPETSDITDQIRIRYDPYWEIGTQHILYVTYSVSGENIDRVITQNVTVTLKTP